MPEQRLPPLALAQAGTDGHHAGTRDHGNEIVRGLHRTHHRFGPAREQCGHVGRPRGHAHQAGPCTQGGFGAQRDGATTALIAPDAQHVAGLALVRIASPRQQPRHQCIVVEQRGVGGHAFEALPGKIQLLQCELTGVFQRIAGVQSDVPHDELQRAGRQHGSAGRTAAIGIHAAGDVQREHRRGLRVDRLDQGPGLALRRTRQADAEQRVHHQVGMRKHGIEQRDPSAGGHVLGACALRDGISRHVRTQVHHVHAASGAVRMPRQHVAVTAIAARPAHHDDALCLGPVLQHVLPRHLSRALHQHIGVAAEGVRGTLVQRPRGLRGIQGPGAGHGRILGPRKVAGK